MRKDKLKQRSMKAGSICQSATPHVSPRPPRVGAYKTSNTPLGVYLKALPSYQKALKKSGSTSKNKYEAINTLLSGKPVTQGFQAVHLIDKP